MHARVSPLCGATLRRQAPNCPELRRLVHNDVNNGKPRPIDVYEENLRKQEAEWQKLEQEHINRSWWDYANVSKGRFKRATVPLASLLGLTYLGWRLKERHLAEYEEMESQLRETRASIERAREEKEKLAIALSFKLYNATKIDTSDIPRAINKAVSTLTQTDESTQIQKTDRTFY